MRLPWLKRHTTKARGCLYFFFFFVCFWFFFFYYRGFFFFFLFTREFGERGIFSVKNYDPVSRLLAGQRWITTARPLYDRWGEEIKQSFGQKVRNRERCKCTGATLRTVNCFAARPANFHLSDKYKLLDLQCFSFFFFFFLWEVNLAS